MKSPPSFTTASPGTPGHPAEPPGTGIVATAATALRATTRTATAAGAATPAAPALRSITTGVTVIAARRVIIMRCWTQTDARSFLTYALPFVIPIPMGVSLRCSVAFFWVSTMDCTYEM
ncbi:hypothetical protein C8F04DRAFT_1234860 [Mycena alexandri]|uniref:Uncharacterized protein n=1 Tax=Mycena alexandri TaxID=1745969 RepID=A0AAD6SU66_9AGAR|nr:hypothetical protein C8F04DRAFT_1234860 [Mycena alexandri]